jgi:DNA excision repair protein ERCC-4
MIIPEEQDGKQDYSSILNQELPQLNIPHTASGQQQKENTPRVIVDIREFRSLLPSLLHKRGLHIEPVTLEVLKITLRQFYKEISF